MSVVKITYDDSSLPTGASDTVLFSTVTAFPTGKRGTIYAGLKRLRYDIDHDAAGNLDVFKSDDRGVNWSHVSRTACTASATATSSGNVNIEAFDDFKIVWNQGAVTQTVWEVDLAMTDQSGT